MDNFKIQCLPMTTLQSHRQKSSESNAAKRKAHILILLFPLFIGQLSFAQTIKGLISGINHEPLFGASVSIKGTTTGTTTDTAGYFSIKAQKGDILRVSFIGYKSKDVKLTDNVFIAVSLLAPDDNLDEV